VTGYDDGRVACTDDEIILRNYYGPFLAKRIGYHYLNWDPHRRDKDRALVIYLIDAAAAEGRQSAVRTPGETAARIKPVMTPDNPDEVMAELAAHGVTVTRGHVD